MRSETQTNPMQTASSDRATATTTASQVEEGGASDGGAQVGHTTPSQRVRSVDVLRGFDMFWISGGDHLFHALATAMGWTWAVIFAHQLEHTPWIGFTCYDLIQPLFLFITGITLPLAVGRRLACGQTRWQITRRLLTRALLLVCLGHLVKNGAISLDVPHIRFTSVLGRIGVAGLAAGLIMMCTSWRGQIWWIIGILVAYWALVSFVPAPGQPAQSFDRGINIVDYLDQHYMPGRLVDGNQDANGWFSTPPVVSTVLLGALAGQWLLSSRSAGRKVLGLSGAGIGLVGLGWAWGHQFPIIKHIWTSSFVLYTAGWSCLLLGLFYGIVDGLRWQRWGFPFLLIGMNPLLIYFLSNTRLVDFPYISRFFLGFTYASASPVFATLWHTVATLAVELALLYWLYRRKCFWRV
jgi:predicted acyltransferase